VRAHITDTIGVVGFVDAGYVGADSFPDFSQEFRIGVGGGVRYFTGLGPLRADVAFPLDRRPGDPTVAFYIGLGQAF
jgi:translocation and assembly module TamA